MSRRTGAILALLLFVVSAAPIGPIPPARAAEEYAMTTAATYSVDPTEREVGVSVDVSFTNTTPDPEGQFSVFSEVLFAVHDSAAEVAAEDGEGALDVAVAGNDAGVNVATVELREPLRYEETAEFTLSYVLPDGGESGVRVRPSVVVFPAWSFGTSGEVIIVVPATYEVRADGDALTAEEAGAQTRLVSGEIADPSQWLALVTATRPGSYTTLTEAVPLQGGTADLQVRTWTDDTEWGERTLALLVAALPRLEEAIGLPYPHVGPLVVTEAVATDPAGFGEPAAGSGEILVAYDQPPFTALHQVAHVWLGSDIIGERWVREGLASHYAAVVAGSLDVEPPFDPAARTEELAGEAFPLESWDTSAEPDADETAGTAERERYGYAASWLVAGRIVETAGADVMTRVLQRAAAGVDPYAPVTPEVPEREPGSVQPLSSRALLDHLELVGDEPVADLFAEYVFAPADVELLPARADARAAYADLIAAADGWGAPDPIRAAMRAWNFENAQADIADARAWLEERDELRAAIAAAGLSVPQRLRDDYMASGGGAAAHDELAAEREVVEAYTAALARASEERSLIERIGLIGGPDPERLLGAANADFAEGDLRAAADGSVRASQVLADAFAAGLVRLVSAVVILAILVAVVVGLVRRRRGPASFSEAARPPAAG